MSRGGKRHGAGRKKSNDPSVTIRVPSSMKETIQHWIKKRSLPDHCGKNGQEEISASLSVLQNALTLKANAGGKIKTEIRQAIDILKRQET